MARGGIEPPTQRFSVPRSTTELPGHFEFALHIPNPSADDCVDAELIECRRIVIPTGDLALLIGFEIEPLPVDHPLWDAPNTILTPHVAVKDAAHLDERRYAIIEQNVGRFVAGDSLLNPVDKAQWF